MSRPPAQLLDDAADKLSRAGYEETAAELRELLHLVEEEAPELLRAEHLAAGPDPRLGAVGNPRRPR